MKEEGGSAPSTTQVQAPPPHISLLSDHQNGQKIGIMITQAIQEMTHIGTPTLT